ncbi:hypothetical protein ACFWYW_14525 [Nonomuraea sp. NPDC059023]|uniref:hypothetical protein n=1 Tax=unclassified Nonomuraea TaxID=2593643 RepID=UPI0036A7AE29
MSLTALIDRIRDDIDDGDQMAEQLGVDLHERVDVRYLDVEALLRVAEVLDRDGHLTARAADLIVERALVDDGDGR